MEQLVCKMCGGNELQLEKDAYVCQHCGCKYTTDMSEIVNFTNKDNDKVTSNDAIETVRKTWADIPRYNSETDNKIYAHITRIGHAEKNFSGQQLVNVFEDGFGITGCGYEMEIYNISGERIKYFTVLSVAYNEVEDKSGAHITRFTGPVEVGKYSEYWVDGIWKDSHIKSAKIESMMIELFDGRKILYDFKDIDNIPENLDVMRFTGSDKIPHCSPDTPNKLYVSVIHVCHEEYDMEASKKAISMGQTELVKKYVEGSGSGDFGVQIELEYYSGKSIKSVKVFLQPLNSVLDEVNEQKVVNITGPIDVGTTGTVYFKLWGRKDKNISSAKIEGVIVNFTDDTSEFYKVSDISNKKAPSQSSTTSASSTSTQSGGCYVATAVYGSYDCPQVWTLRRYRDYTLAETWHGRAFIKVYYAISPTLVKLFGHTEWFKKMWQGKLDKMVADLQEKGVKSTPYEDKQW